MKERFDHIASLPDEWVYGAVAVDKEKMYEFANNFMKLFENSPFVTSYIYPRSDGGINIEWDIGDWNVSFETDKDFKVGVYESLNLVSYVSGSDKNESEEYEIELTFENLEILFNKLKELKMNT